MTQSEIEVQQRLELAKRIAQSAGQITLNYFQTDKFEVQKKGDGSPLTIADQASEKHLREEISQAFPDDAIVGEEFGAKDGSSGYRWVLDPIDGTKSFISGVPLYGTMVGVEVDGNAVIGSVYVPGLDEGIYAATGLGAWWYRNGKKPVPARVSTRTNLEDCVLVTSESETFADRDAGGVYKSLVDSVYFARTWGDVYGYMLVATGRVDVMIDPVLNIWDAAAVQPIIKEAGGRFSDWAGDDRIDSGEAIGSNGHIHESILAFTRSNAGNFGSYKVS